MSFMGMLKDFVGLKRLGHDHPAVFSSLNIGGTIVGDPQEVVVIVTTPEIALNIKDFVQVELQGHPDPRCVDPEYYDPPDGAMGSGER